MRAPAIAMAAAIACGCSLSWTGHNIRRESLGELVRSRVSEREVIERLGPPENVVYKSAGSIKVLVYQSIVTMHLGIPFLISVGRGRQSGYTANLVFQDGRLTDFELIEMKQKLLWR